MLVLVDRSLAAEIPLQVLEATRQIVRVNALAPFLQGVADLPLGVAEHRLPPTGEEDPVGLGVPIPHTVPGTFPGELPARFALPQRCLGLLVPLEHIPPLQGRAHRQGQALAVLLDHMVGRPSLHALDRPVLADRTGDDDEGDERLALLEQSQRSLPVESR